MRPGRYKPRILRFWDMTVAANGEIVLAVLWRSPQSAARFTGVLLLRFPAKSTGCRQITLVRSSLDPSSALRRLSPVVSSAPAEILR